jgi:hypothetical protein
MHTCFCVRPTSTARIIGRDGNGKAGRSRLARGAAGLTRPECLPAHRLQRVVQVVVQELAPLHHHVGQLGVGGYGGGGDEAARDLPGTGFAIPVVQSLRIITLHKIVKYFDPNPSCSCTVKNGP